MQTNRLQSNAMQDRIAEDRITIDPRIQHGKPVIKGTRVPVARIVGGLAGGMSIAEVMEAYAVSDADVRAALAFANRFVEEQGFYPLPKSA